MQSRPLLRCPNCRRMRWQYLSPWGCFPYRSVQDLLPAARCAQSCWGGHSGLQRLRGSQQRQRSAASPVEVLLGIGNCDVEYDHENIANLAQHTLSLMRLRLDSSCSHSHPNCPRHCSVFASVYLCVGLRTVSIYIPQWKHADGAPLAETHLHEPW